MIITSKTKLKDIWKVLPVAELAKTDILAECSKFEMPKKIRGIEIMKHSKITILQQSWIWDIKETDKLLIAYAEIFFGITKNHEKWLKECPLIDFYRFAHEVKEQSKRYADEFANIRVELSEDEKKAGYGDADPHGLAGMVASMADKRGVSMEVAWNYPIVEYIFVFSRDAAAANKQRAYNKIISEKK